MPGPDGSGLLCELDDDGSGRGSPLRADDLGAVLAEREDQARSSGAEPVRWVWANGASVYPPLLRAGTRVARCHDVALTEALLCARDQSADDRLGWGRPDAGEPAPDWPAPDRAAPDWAAPDWPGRGASTSAGQPALFEPTQAGAPAPPDPADALDMLIHAHKDQLARIAADEHPARFGLLVAAESAGGLAAAEMTQAGLPWRADVHDALLTELLGPHPASQRRQGRRGASQAPPPRPARLAELAAQISAAFGASEPGSGGRDGGGQALAGQPLAGQPLAGHSHGSQALAGPGASARRPVNPDSPAQLLRALAADGIRLPSTRTAVLAGVDHPAIAPLLEYKELSRLYSAFGWTWLETWVADGRFRSEYIVGGVVSGRWASRGGGALQIPRLLRRAVVADPGWVLVVADAAQLEPRVLAALAGDHAFAAAAAGGDLYAELAGAFGGDRAKAKLATLSAMYGGAGGEAGQLLAVLRQRFPAAAGYVEAAARAGEEGRVVRSVLGRTCPPPSASWRALTGQAGDPEAEPDPQAGRASRARGRFTRNFVVQASAADWALVMLVSLRTRLSRISMANGPSSLDDPSGLVPSPRAPSEMAPRLVFFQHDEVIVHCRAEQADAVAATVSSAAADATRLVFGPTPVTFPLNVAVVECYADAK